jgi:hypothetical protein
MSYIMASVILAYHLFCPSPIQAQKYSTHGGNKYIDALVSAPILVTYVNDGAADMSVTNVDANSMSVAIVENPIPSVRNIVNLGWRAIPLLIEHLDDTRLTAAKLCSYYAGGKKRCAPVPVGYVCADILTHIITAPKIITLECGDDGFGACIDSAYYFLPDAYTQKASRYYARPKVYRVKINWQRAYRKGYIKYHYPDQWKRRI